MKKRGQLSYLALIILILILVVFVPFLEAGESYGSQDAFYKLAVAEDIALIINTLYATPGDVEMIYDQDLSKYSVIVQDNLVKVYKTSLGVTDITAGKHRFFGPGSSYIKVENPKNLIISKIKGQITISKE